jgi:DNA-binding PadR family transcriptional regulator
MFGHDFDNFGPMGGGRHGGFGGRFRAGRGMMEPAILQALFDKPMHGYEIITTLEERSHGMWRPSAGSIYPTLQLLEEKDFLTSEARDGKKIYSLTEAGKTAADEAKEQHAHHEAMWEHHGKDFKGMHDFRHEFGKAMRLLWPIVQDGNDEQKEQLKTEINNFTEALQRIRKQGR